MFGGKVLSNQFMDHAELSQLHAVDFPGKIGDPDPVGRMESWQEKFGGTGEARHYDEGETPRSKVEALRAEVRERGVDKPIHVVDWGTHRSVYDGHHRAVAAHLEGQGAPVNIEDQRHIGLGRNQ